MNYDLGKKNLARCQVFVKRPANAGFGYRSNHLPRSKSVGWNE